MLTVSVTELIDFGDCHRKWALRHSRRLQPKNRPPNLASGTVVHGTIGEALAQTGRGPWLDEVAEERLLEEFKHSENQAELVKKYLAGVQRALAKCPSWVFEHRDWRIEDRLTMLVPTAASVIDGLTGAGLGAVELVGRPDLYRRTDDGFELVEIKTTENDPLDYLLWNPQHRYYCAMLQAAHPQALITFRYLCLPTQGKLKEHSPWVFTGRAYQNTMVDLQHRCRDWAAAIGQQNAINEPNEGWRCKSCDFSAVCAVYITGGSMESVIAEQFTVRPHRS